MKILWHGSLKKPADSARLPNLNWELEQEIKKMNVEGIAQVLRKGGQISEEETKELVTATKNDKYKDLLFAVISERLATLNEDAYRVAGIE